MPEIEFALWTELLVNAVAVLLGGIGALALARWQMKRESAAEKQRSREHLASNLEWLWLELSENEELIAELRRVFARGSTPRMDLLRWAGSIAEAIAFDAQAALIRSGYHREVSPDTEREILRTYQVVTELRNMLRQAEPAVEFYVNCCGEESSARELVEDLHSQTALAADAVAALRERLVVLGREYGRRFSRPEDAEELV